MNQISATHPIACAAHAALVRPGPGNAGDFALALTALAAPGALPLPQPGGGRPGELPGAAGQMLAGAGKDLPEIDLDLTGDEEGAETDDGADPDTADAEDVAFAWFAPPAQPIAEAVPVGLAPVAVRVAMDEAPAIELSLLQSAEHGKAIAGAPPAETVPVAATRGGDDLSKPPAATPETVVPEYALRGRLDPKDIRATADPDAMPKAVVPTPSMIQPPAAAAAAAAAPAPGAAAAPAAPAPAPAPASMFGPKPAGVPETAALSVALPASAGAPVSASVPSPSPVSAPAPPTPPMLAPAPASAPISTNPPAPLPETVRAVAGSRVDVPFAVAPDSVRSAQPAASAASRVQPGMAASAPRVGAADTAPAITTAARLMAQAFTQPMAQPFAAPLRRAPGELSDQPMVTSITAPSAAMLQQVSATPATQQGALDMRRQEWMGQMIDRIETMRGSGPVRETRIALMPDALGKVDISVRQDGDRVHVHFAAETHAARQILTDAQPRLAELAESRGVRLGQTSVDSGQSNAQTGAQTGHQRQDDARRPQAPSAPASARAHDPAPGDERIA